MFYYVMDRFLRGHNNVVTRLAGNLDIGRQVRHSKPARQLWLFAKVVGHLTQVISQRVEVVILRIHGPNRLIQSCD